MVRAYIAVARIAIAGRDNAWSGLAWSYAPFCAGRRGA
jgi:hypothetical protein